MLTFDFEEWAGTYNFYQANFYSKTKREVDFLLEHQIPATFFLDAHSCNRYPEAVDLLVENKFELALHSDFHPGATIDPRKINGEKNGRVKNFDEETAENQRDRLQNAIQMIRENIPDFNPSGFRSPHLKWNMDLFETIKQLGIKWDSSQKAEKFDTYQVNGITEIPMNSEDYDSACFKRRPQYILAVWKDRFNKANKLAESRKRDTCFTLLFHPSVCGTRKHFGMLRAIYNHLTWFDVNYTTCGKLVSETPLLQSA